MTKYESNWMVYASFHPRTKASSWHYLGLVQSKFSDDALQIFKDTQENPKRALSTTRLAVLTGVVTSSDVQSDWQQLAAVRSGAKDTSSPMLSETLCFCSR